MLPVVTTKEAQRQLGISRTKVFQLRREGRLETVALSARCIRVTQRSIDALLEAHIVTPPAPAPAHPQP